MWKKEWPPKNNTNKQIARTQMRLIKKFFQEKKFKFNN